MHWSWVPRTAVLSSLIALGAVALLPGCALNGWRSTGIVDTQDRKPFSLSSPNQQLLIAPGSMTITPSYNSGTFGSSSLVIGTPTGKLTIPLHRGEVTADTLRIVGVTHGLSANIDGTWERIAQSSPYDVRETESCTTSGHCNHEETEKECHDDKCKTKTHTVYGYYSSCPGHRPVTVTYQHYARAYRIAFLNPQNTTQVLGTYNGLSPMERVRLGSRDAGYCTLD